MDGGLPSLGDRLDDARAKLRAADKHLRALQHSLKRFGRRDPYTVVVEQYDSEVLKEPAWVLLEARASRLGTYPLGPGRLFARTWLASVSLESRQNPPVREWATGIGDAVHNLCSALDLLARQLYLVGRDSTQPRPAERELAKHRERDLAFPYCEHPEEWPKAADRRLPFVGPAARAVIERAQPYHARENERDPAVLGHPLGVLHELWNRDKHEALNLTVVAGAFVGAQVRPLGAPPEAPELRVEKVADWPLRPLVGKTQVAIIRIHFPQPTKVPTQVKMHVHNNFSLGILFGDGMPGEGSNVLALLGAGRNEVARLLDTFR